MTTGSDLPQIPTVQDSAAFWSALKDTTARRPHVPTTTYEYLFSEDNGRTWRTVGLVSAADVEKIQLLRVQPPYRRRFVLV